VREVFVRILDDLDKTSDVQAANGRTVTVGYLGKWFALDLTGEHVKALEKLLGPYLRAGRETGDGQPPMVPRGGGYMEARQFKAEAREWGKDNGWPDLEPGGYIPKALTTAYREHLEKVALEQA
jgi:hypothetical protein